MVRSSPAEGAVGQKLRFDDDAARRLERMYQSADAVRRRREALRLLALAPGERVLDIGCGPGFVAAELGAAVGPEGAVHALDSSPAMVEMTRRRCAPSSWITVAPGDAATLELPDASFDAVVSIQVHEYVSEIEAALRDVQRVLRPGGRALVVATDWDSIVWASSDPARMGRVLSAFEEHLAHLHLPRELGPLLRAAGFDTPRCEVVVQLNPSLEPDSFSAGLLGLIRDFVPGRRGVTRQEADAWADELRERGRQGSYFFSLNQYFFLASKL
jgi:SAM-dependent methyltransferase